MKIKPLCPFCKKRPRKRKTCGERECYLLWLKEYCKTPKRKLYQKNYLKRPEVKERRKITNKKYRDKPEVKARKSKYSKKYYQKNKDKIKKRCLEYFHDPKNKEKIRQHQKNYYQKKKKSSRREIINECNKYIQENIEKKEILKYEISKLPSKEGLEDLKQKIFMAEVNIEYFSIRKKRIWHELKKILKGFE